MFGLKINEFDNSDGTVDSFNKAFPKTGIVEREDYYVEIGSIVERENMFESSPYVRYLRIYDGDYNLKTKVEHDFGESNFYYNEDFIASDKIQFKYCAKDLNGVVLAKGYSCEEVARKLGCHISVIKRRLGKRVDENSNTKNLFNITRKEI